MKYHNNFNQRWEENNQKMLLSNNSYQNKNLKFAQSHKNKCFSYNLIIKKMDNLTWGECLLLMFLLTNFQCFKLRLQLYSNRCIRIIGRNCLRAIHLLIRGLLRDWTLLKTQLLRNFILKNVKNAQKNNNRKDYKNKNLR